jgi:hypothetical protein
MTARRPIAVLLTLVLSLGGGLSSFAPSATAQTLAEGISVTGDFRGTGSSQIATLYDPKDDLGLRMIVLTKDATADTFASSEWYLAGANAFDLGRMKVVATDVDFDGKTDIVVLYDDGGTSVRLLVWRSTGTSFAYQGNAGWWQSNGYAWSRTKAMLSGNFSAVGHNGLLLVYQYDNFDMRIHYLESNGSAFIYNGNQGVYDSGPGQYDMARARFLTGHFTRTGGPDQVASFYQYANFQIRIHVFDPSPTGLQPVNGWTGVWQSPTNFYDLARARFAAADIDGDGRTDIVGFYSYPDGSTRIHLFSAANGLALSDTAGLAAFGANQMPWTVTQLVGGDMNRDGKGDLATLTAVGDGTTHLGYLRSTGTTVSYLPDEWVTPANEVQKLGCANCWPLSGAPIVAGGPSVARRPLAVKIDNAPTARPHHGISQADMVVELLVEGFITRLAAYFHSQDPQTIGAVRSVRFSDRYTTPMVRGSLIFSGASQLMQSLVLGDIANNAYVGVSPQLGQGNAFYRTNVDGKVAPHNLFTSSAALRAATNDVGGGGPVSVPRWDFLSSPVHPDTTGGFGGAVPATTLAIPYRLDARVRYDYDAASHTYARYQSSTSSLTYEREVDGANGVAIAARNVVIITTDVWVTDVVDDAGGAASLDMRLTGTGPATIFRDGLRQEGTWSRATYFDPFTFATRSGTKIYLSPGQTWIHILPLDWTVPSS